LRHNPSELENAVTHDPRPIRPSSLLLLATVGLLGAAGCDDSDDIAVPSSDAAAAGDVGTTHDAAPSDGNTALGDATVNDADALLDAGAGDGDVTDAADAADAAALDFIALQQGAPEAVVWDDAKSTLYILDNTGNRVWTWTDATGLSAAPYAVLPLPANAVDAGTLPANATLGQAALLEDGTLVVNRFGAPGGLPGYGDITYVHADGGTGTVPNLDATRRRLGLAVAPDKTLYSSYFASTSDGGITGSITTVDLAAGESVVADGFGKIVGLAIANGRMYVSDQSAGKVFDAPLTSDGGGIPAHAADWHSLATFVKPDQICVGPDGASLFSGQFQGAPGSTEAIAVRQISTSTGSVTVFKQDPDVSKPSGLGYDATHKRLFVADSGNTSKIGIHIFPVP
jgi:sugar lactone lactonase YvrE